jgi:hypothetical protein
MSVAPLYPVRVGGELDPKLSRWLWLVKWLLAIPHYVVLAFLWLAFVVLSVAAFFAIVFTGRYPRSIFDFNVGVLRWSWRVAFYSYSALGTDRYPPFTLAEAPDYPATLEIPYPEQLSRGLVLVKWWLLAIPHYLVVGILVGGGYVAWGARGFGAGLVGVLVLIAAVALLFTGRYPSGIFELVLGLNRWVLRVAAYAALMTDRYPPFRLDLGGTEPGTIAVEAADPAEPASAAEPAGWTVGRILLLVLGSLAAIAALALLAAGGVALWADRTQRDADGFVMTHARDFSTSTYALVSERVDTTEGPDWLYSRDLLGTVRIRSDSELPVFVGIAREADVQAYLGGVEREVVADLGEDPDDRTPHAGGPPAPPAAQDIWVASATGSGERTLEWKVEDGAWTAVLMNADGSGSVSSDLSIGARLEALVWLAVGLLAGGGVVLAAAAAAALVFGVRGRRRAA